MASVTSVTRTIRRQLLVDISDELENKTPIADVRNKAIEAAVAFDPDLAGWNVVRFRILQSFNDAVIEFEHTIQEDD